MTTARTVPVTVEMDGDELDAENAWHTARRVGIPRLLRDAFLRFRMGDGFSSSRALALQAALAVVPFLLALTGLASGISQEEPAQVVAHTVQSISPGSGSNDALGSAVTGSQANQSAGQIALWLGLIFAIIAMTSAVAEIERGMNRIYGIRRDRPALHKYARAAALTGILALPVSIGFLLIVAGAAFAEAMTQGYHWNPTIVFWFSVVRWPIGLALLVFSITVVLDHAPRRRQPQLSWLVLGSGVAILLTSGATGLLAGYVGLSPSFGQVYGPLAGMFALLLWALLFSMALFFGAAVCAQLESCHAGQTTPAYDDPGRPERAHV